MIGVAIITFQSPEDAAECLKSVLAHTLTTGPIIVWDNSQDFKTGTLLLSELGSVEYVRSPANVGCCISRNHIWERFLALGVTHGVVLDQDVRVTADGWLEDMAAVFEKHPDTGIVSWDCINQQMAHHVPDATGAVPEMPGACCMYSAACVRAVGGWESRVLYHRFEDSAFCFEAAAKGFKVRLVHGVQKIAHPAPGGGTGRNPRNETIKEASNRLYAEMSAQRGWPSVG